MLIHVGNDHRLANPEPHPFGHEWLLGSHIEDVTPEEMQRRFNAMFERAGQTS